MMRIAIVAQNLVYGDGQGRINLEIARQAILAGHSVTLVSVVVDDELIKAGATWEPVQVRRKPILVRVAQFPILANRIIDRLRREEKIDHVIANGYTLTRKHDLNLSQFVHAAWLRSGVHATATKGVIRRLYQEFYTRYNAFFEKRSYRAACFVVAPSMRTFSELRKIGIRAAKLRRIPNGVNSEEFSPGPRERKELSLPEDVPMALFAGDIRTNRKGLGSVLSALSMLPKVHLAVVGKSEGSPFVELAKELGLENRVHFLGFRKDVPRVLRACDLFVFPSWYDPFGLVVTEALSCGVPVVTTVCTGAGELLTEATGTLIHDPADISSLAFAMADWLLTPGKATGAAAACRAIAQSNGWEAMADQYLDLLKVEQSNWESRYRSATSRLIEPSEATVSI